MALVLIESPNKISKLQKILGPGYKIMASVGHVMDLAKSKMGINTDTLELEYKVNPDKKDIVKNIKAEAKNHDVIYLATDPDREGEAIAFHLSTLLPSTGVTVHRVKFNAITSEAVKKAMKNPGVLDSSLYDAQRARRAIDRLVGFKVSPVMWNKGMVGTSAGRVQSVALRLIADREKEIKAFKPEEYWTLEVETDKDFTAEFWGVDSKDYPLPDQASVDAVVAAIKASGKKLKVVDYQAKTRSRKTAPPFTTSTMQQAASNSFGWGAKKTMSVAQDLFGHGLITYHRTDSTRVEPSKIQELRDKVEQTYGKKYLSPSVINYGPSDGSQDAHEAIRPTYDTPVSALSKDEKRLLTLIENRFMASQMADAEYDQVSVRLEVQDTKAYCFKQTGSILTFDGFLKVYGEVKEDLILPQMKIGDEFGWKALNTQQHYTKPPPRYSDASIIKILEKEGVGRPSTYASILETLEERKYTEKNGKSLGATEIGIMVSDFLTERFPEIVDTGFTSDMESKLDQMADGKVEFKEFVKEFLTSLDDMLTKATSSQMPVAFEVEHSCPKCSSNMIKKISKHGPFLGCKNWPACDGVLTIAGEKNANEKVETGHSCPSCSNILILRKGKNGDFFGCKAYPNCKYTAPVGEDGNPGEAKKAAPKDTEVKCPKCKKGHMQERTGKFGKFYGCSAYPKCKNIMKSIEDASINQTE